MIIQMAIMRWCKACGELHNVEKEPDEVRMAHNYMCSKSTKKGKKNVNRRHKKSSR